jgi:hypothetical protein
MTYASYPHLARLCYKRCAVEQGVQRAGCDPGKRPQKELGGDASAWAAAAADERGADRAEESTASHLSVAAAREDASRFCPVCSRRLESRRCKLVCNVCGYYMSCADYY